MKPGKDYIGVGVGAFILNDKGEVLLMRRGPNSKNEIGFWSFPGGKVEFGETLRETVMREALEETGVEIELDGQLPAIDHIIPGEGQHWVTNIFPARIAKGIPKIMEPEKCDRMEWFPLDAMPSPLAGQVQSALDTFLAV